MLIDLHTHTHPGSWDSYLTPDELIERSKQAGIGGLVLSEHDWAWDPEEVKRLAKRHDFLVLPGMEINTEDGHILVYGMHRYVYGMHRSHELAGHVLEDDGVMIAAHPYRRQHPWNWESEKEWEDALDRARHNMGYRFISAMEVGNGRGKTQENTFAVAIAETMGFHGTAATDSHATADIGKAVTYFEAKIETEQDLIDAIRGGRFWPVDLTRGAVLADPIYHDVPVDMSDRLRDLDEQRAAFLAAHPHAANPLLAVE
jgi:predicted metal-dependent phosphoesterase TrpH